MTDEQHPIAPPPELVQQWWTEFERTEPDTDSLVFIATQAARWGADQELEAICDWLELHYPHVYTSRLRRCRRPKPPSLREQALEAQQRMWNGGVTREDWELVRRALEALPND